MKCIINYIITMKELTIMDEKIMVIEEELLELLDKKQYDKIREVLLSMNAVDIASLFNELPIEKLPVLFRLLPKYLASETFVDMDADAQEHLIIGFSDNELKDVFEVLYLDDTVDIIEEMPANVVKRIISNSDSDRRKLINQILIYPEHSAGSIMTVEYVSLRRDMTVGEALKRIRRTGIDKETIYTCYVTDNNRKLIGIVSAKSLLLSEEDSIIEDIMKTNFVFVHTFEDKEIVANILNKYDLISLPVVDDEERLVGIVTFDDAIDVLQEEATEDIEMMAGITPSDKPYLKTSALEIWRARIPWLLLFMILATFTTIIISSFQDALQTQIILSSFIPMLTGTGGNSGSQASTTIIRGLALGEIEVRDILKIVFKESRVAILCGLSLSILNFARMYMFDNVSIYIALVVSLTLVVTVFFAKLVGSTLPIFAKRFGFDPAVMASPFITTIIDVLTLLIYFKFSTLILQI